MILKMRNKKRGLQDKGLLDSVKSKIVLSLIVLMFAIVIVLGVMEVGDLREGEGVEFSPENQRKSVNGELEISKINSVENVEYDGCSVSLDMLSKGGYVPTTFLNGYSS